MNCCEAEGFRLGRFHPRLEIDDAVMQAWTNRDVLQLTACKQCPAALICGGGCGRIVSSGGGDLRADVACPPLANMRDLQVLIDYYLPLILERRQKWA